MQFKDTEINWLPSYMKNRGKHIREFQNYEIQQNGEDSEMEIRADPGSPAWDLLHVWTVFF